MYSYIVQMRRRWEWFEMYEDQQTIAFTVDGHGPIKRKLYVVRTAAWENRCEVRHCSPPCQIPLGDGSTRDYRGWYILRVQYQGLHGGTTWTWPQSIGSENWDADGGSVLGNLSSSSFNTSIIWVWIWRGAVQSWVSRIPRKSRILRVSRLCNRVHVLLTSLDSFHVITFPRLGFCLVACLFIS